MYARRAEQAPNRHLAEGALAEVPQLTVVELDVVVRVDDLVRAAESEPVGGDEDRLPAGLEHARGLGQHLLGIRHVLERLHREHRCELTVAEGQVAHVRDDRRRSWPANAAAIYVDADGLARREQVVAVTDAAAEVEDAPRAQERRG